MPEKSKGEGLKGGAIVIDNSTKCQMSLGAAARSTKGSLTGRDEGKLKQILYARDVNVPVDSSWTSSRTFLARIVISNSFENFMGIVILAQFCFAIVEVDKSAQKEEIPAWLQCLMLTFLTIYVVELSTRFYVLRCQFFKSWANLLDVFVVFADCCIQFVELSAGNMPSISVLRIFRLTRLLRAFRVLTTFRELYIMVHSFMGVMKAIFWAALIIFMVLTLWSILAVEFLHPLNQELADAGVHKDCQRCRHAYESVMQASLTFFSQIIAGDSWSTITVAMIEKYPWTTLIYIPAYVTIGMGLINLVLTVIVDRADAAKKANEEEKLHLKLMALKVIFSNIGQDSNGYVSVQEFTESLGKSPEMKQALELLGIRMEDLGTVVLMMDYNRSGSVSCEEFVENLLKMKSEDTFMILLYVKHFMNVMEKQIGDHVDLLREEVGKTFRHSSNGKIEPLHFRVDSTNDGTSICGAGGPSCVWPTQAEAAAPCIGYQALKQDVQTMCRSTEAKLEEMVRVVTNKLDEYFVDQKMSARPASPKGFETQLEDVVAVTTRRGSQLIPVRQLPQLAAMPERCSVNAPSTARSTSRTNPWEIICGDMEMGSSYPYREIFKPNGEHFKPPGPTATPMQD